MSPDARTVTVEVERSATVVFDAFTDPRNLSAWARASNVRPAAEGWWTFDTPKGEAAIRFHADRATLVADHEYGDAKRSWHVPARVVADGERANLSLTLHRPAGMDDAGFERQVTAVEEELESFRRWLEKAAPSDPEGMQ